MVRKDRLEEEVKKKVVVKKKKKKGNQEQGRKKAGIGNTVREDGFEEEGNRDASQEENKNLLVRTQLGSTCTGRRNMRKKILKTMGRRGQGRKAWTKARRRESEEDGKGVEKGIA